MASICVIPKKKQNHGIFHCSLDRFSPTIRWISPLHTQTAVNGPARAGSCNSWWVSQLQCACIHTYDIYIAQAQKNETNETTRRPPCEMFNIVFSGQKELVGTCWTTNWWITKRSMVTFGPTKFSSNENKSSFVNISRNDRILRRKYIFV